MRYTCFLGAAFAIIGAACVTPASRPIPVQSAPSSQLVVRVGAVRLRIEAALEEREHPQLRASDAYLRGAWRMHAQTLRDAAAVLLEPLLEQQSMWTAWIGRTLQLSAVAEDEDEPLEVFVTERESVRHDRAAIMVGGACFHQMSRRFCLANALARAVVEREFVRTEHASVQDARMTEAATWLALLLAHRMFPDDRASDLMTPLGEHEAAVRWLSEHLGEGVTVASLLRGALAH